MKDLGMGYSQIIRYGQVDSVGGLSGATVEMQKTYICPHCGTSIALDELVRASMEEEIQRRVTHTNQEDVKHRVQDELRRHLQQHENRARERLEELQRDHAERLRQMQERERELNDTLHTKVNDEVSKRWQEREALMRKDLKVSLEQEWEMRMKIAQDHAANRDAKYKEMVDQNTKLVQHFQELQDRLRESELEKGNLALEVQKKLEQRIQGDHQLLMADKDKQISELRHQIDALHQRAQSSSERRQGEVMELELEAMLRQAFPADDIIPVPKGQEGGDIVHRVQGTRSESGDMRGKIVWESKRTKHWSPAWIEKLRYDRRYQKADIGVIVSMALPEDVTTFVQQDDVWIVSWEHAIPLARVLRVLLQQLSRVRLAQDDLHDRAHKVYAYLCGQRFQDSLKLVFSRIDAMKSELESEKKSLQKSWAKRDRQLDDMIMALMGIAGDLDGIASLQIDAIANEDHQALPEPPTPTILPPKKSLEASV